MNGFFGWLQQAYQLVALSEQDVPQVALLWTFWLLVVRFQRIPHGLYRWYVLYLVTIPSLT